MTLIEEIVLDMLLTSDLFGNRLCRFFGRGEGLLGGGRGGGGGEGEEF